MPRRDRNGVRGRRGRAAVSRCRPCRCRPSPGEQPGADELPAHDALGPGHLRPAGISRSGSQNLFAARAEVAGVDRSRRGGRPGSRRQHAPGAVDGSAGGREDRVRRQQRGTHRNGFSGEHRRRQLPACGRELGVGEPLPGEDQCTGGVDVGVARTVGVHDRPIGPPPGQEPVRALQVLAGPRPHDVEPLPVAERDRDEHPVRLAFADGVTAFVATDHAAIPVDVTLEEGLPGSRGRGHRVVARGDIARVIARAAGDQNADQRDRERQNRASPPLPHSARPGPGLSSWGADAEASGTVCTTGPRGRVRRNVTGAADGTRVGSTTRGRRSAAQNRSPC